MAFQKGSNRETIYLLLSDQPITIDKLAMATGLEDRQIESVLVQIGALGHAKRIINGKGIHTYVLGNGVPKKAVKRAIPELITDKLMNYLKDHVGKEVNQPAMIKKLKIKNFAAPQKVLRNLVDGGQLSLSKRSSPRTWKVHQSILGKPKPLGAPNIKAPTLGAPNVPIAHLDTSLALVQLHSGLQQLVSLHEQMNDVLESLGLLED
jgi:hypothetical protein